MSLTKTSFLIISWIAGYFNIHYMPTDLIAINTGAIFLTAKALCYGICAGYTFWLLWHDQIKIYCVLEAVWFINKDRIKGFYNKTN